MSPAGGSFPLLFILVTNLISINAARDSTDSITLPPFRQEKATCDRASLNLAFNQTGSSDFITHITVSVLNFVSLPVSPECLSDDGRRSGVCLNNYECKIQQGVAMGNCALGFGVCCVFSSTCGGEAFNNVTYFTSPRFPGLNYKSLSCYFKIRKISPHIGQVRMDLVHFNLAQPNRGNGICETDVMSIETKNSPYFQLCGFNSGQHLYFDVEDVKELNIVLNMTKDDLGRMWEIKITQIEFRQRAPTGCLQYYRGQSGTIQTMNFAVNGRHLAEQDYTICMRQESGMCSIVYEPCDENSFKIGPPSSMQVLHDDEGSGFGSISSRADDCNDRIVMPCDSEEFLTPRESIPGICDLLHCGTSFCSPGEPCRIESSTTPFNIHVQFGRAPENESPDDNLGMCLKYQQQACS